MGVRLGSILVQMSSSMTATRDMLLRVDVGCWRCDRLVSTGDGLVALGDLLLIAGNQVNDIALLKLNTTTYNLELRALEGHPTAPVKLCPESFQPQGKSCTVSGWGHLKSKGSGVPDNLREVQVQVLHDSICAKMLAGYPWDKETKTMLCAGGKDKDACQGDSGGPMVCEDDSGESCLAGVVSWGVGCATEGIPGVYTNVRKYNNWINTTLGGDFDDFKEVSETAEAIEALKQS